MGYFDHFDKASLSREIGEDNDSFKNGGGKDGDSGAISYGYD
jgi:hypothetical protein